MSPEFIQVVLILTFLGICAMVGEILVQGHRDKVADERVDYPVSRKSVRRAARKARKGAADIVS